MKTTWKITFPDGHSFRAPTAEAALEAWRKKSWHPWEGADWPQVLAKRAYVWSGAIVDPELPAEELLAALAEAGLVKVTKTERR
jgi:hypothetical protein